MLAERSPLNGSGSCPQCRHRGNGLPEGSGGVDVLVLVGQYHYPRLLAAGAVLRWIVRIHRVRALEKENKNTLD